VFELRQLSINLTTFGRYRPTCRWQNIWIYILVGIGTRSVPRSHGHKRWDNAATRR